ncbi:MAG TPA: AAA family ATPase [Chloroflexi bacterium]|nr:AAA family ATPase [Chloroflexota bacterium]
MLNLKLLGAPQITLHDAPFTLRRNSIKARALLYYLATVGTLEPRERLAGLFWSDWPEAKARAYLRGEVHLLSDLKDVYLLDADGRLGLNLERCRVDVREVQRVLAASTATLDELHVASRLVTGPFLDGVDSQLEESSPLFVEWLMSQRDQIARQLDQLLYRLACACADEGRILNIGIDACTELLDRMPEREEVHRLKMRLLALDGQRGAALKQYDACASALMDEIGVLPSAETNALYDRILAGEFDRHAQPVDVSATEAAPPRAPFQAIAPPVHLAGRAQELAQIAAALTRPGRGAVVAVVGMGGVGKTALAAELADRLRNDFPDGVLWGRVATDAPPDILQSWALAFDRDLSKISGYEARAAAMRDILSDRRALIVLDDVVAGKPIDLLLPGASPCAVLITTRDRAEVARYTSEIVELNELSTAAGLEMLTHLLGEAVIAAERAAAEELCQLLDGLPLAVEIAAQRVLASPRRDLARMVRSLRSASARLTHGISNRSVRTSFEVSWESLDAPLRRTFAVMGLFDGRPFSVAALAACAGLEPDTALDRLDWLATLSMLKLAEGDRYVQHRLLADFALEKLAALPDRSQVEERFIAYYRSVTQRAASDFVQLEQEWDHLLHAIQIAHVQQACGEVLALVDAAAAPWFVRARFHQARQGLQAGLDAARTLGDEAHITRFAFFLGRIALRQDDYAAARELLTTAIAGYAAAGNHSRMAEALVDLADVEMELGAYVHAEHNLQRAEAIYGALEQPIGLAAVRCREASIAYDRNDFVAATRLCKDALQLLPAEGGEVVRSRTLRLLADIAAREKQYALAQQYTTQAQVVNAAINDQTEYAAILFAQAKLAHYFGNEQEALTSARQSLAGYTAMGDRKAAAVIHLLLCRIYRALGDQENLQATAQQGRRLAAELQDAQIETWFEEYE